MCIRDSTYTYTIYIYGAICITLMYGHAKIFM
jgi:hypothetical protein